MEQDERAAWESATRPLVTERIRDASAENLSALARAMGTTPKTIYALREGKHAPDIFTLYLLARETGRDMEWFVSGAELTTEPVLVTWAAERAAKNQPVPDDALAFLRALRLRGARPSPVFYNLALVAFENGLTPAEAVVAAAASQR